MMGFNAVTCFVSLSVLFPRSSLAFHCGGIFTEDKGVLSTPDFPNRFQVPIQCEWVITQSSPHPSASIVVYLTQLYVQEGLTFHEYHFYEGDYQLEGKLIHEVNETNVVKVSYVQTFQNYLVIRLMLHSIEGTHIRVLDHFLDVFGFNITYEVTTDKVREDRCTMKHCGFTGLCYDNFE